MSISENVSVPSALNATISFSVTGTNTLAYAQAFSATLFNAQNAGQLTFDDLDHPVVVSPGATTIEYTISQPGLSATIPDGDGYLFDYAAGSTTVTGSGGGDTVLAVLTGGTGGMEYLDEGGDNSVTFVNGNNTYIGDAAGGPIAVDTVVAGYGHDTITTGTNQTVVESGAGNALITLNDTQAGGSNGSGVNDIVSLSEGQNTVDANGAADAVFASSPGQTINAGQSGADVADVQISSPQPGEPSDDVVNAGAGTLNLFDEAGGSTINGGTGTLLLLAEPASPNTPFSDTVNGGSAADYIFGAPGASFTFSSPADAQTSVFESGSGNETFNAAGAAAELGIYGSNVGGGQYTTGSGEAIFELGAPQSGVASDTITGTTGGIAIFGNSGDETTLITPANNAGATIAAALGSETIDAAGAAGGLFVFGNATGTLALQSGSGLLLFAGGDSPGSAAASSVTTLTVGSGGADIFGNEGDSISLASSGTGGAVFAAGAGNETLNAATFSSNLTVFADNPSDTLSGSLENLSVVGGSGTNVFLTGAGAESLVGGSGVNDFDLNRTIDGLGGTLTIFNYTSSDYITFNGFTAAEVQEAISSAVATTNGLVGTQILLSDNTTVLFVDADPSALKFV
jgi:hypothetical protein